jgi:hypothetical protein
MMMRAVKGRLTDYIYIYIYRRRKRENGEKGKMESEFWEK